MKRILHCHSTFSLGGKEARAVQLMNAFGDAAKHTILSAVPDAISARDAIAPGIDVEFPRDAPSLTGKPSIARYRDLARYMARFDLVLSYNWGAMDAVGSRRIFPRDCPPLVHHEDGFNADEAVRLNWKRSGFRRLMLPAAQAVVVPSHTLETIARRVWRQPAERLHRIPNGIATAAYSAPPEPGSIEGLDRRPGEVVVGTLAGLRPVKNLPRLVRAVATLPPHVRLVIIGEGPEREAIVAEAERTGMTGRLLMPGFLPEPRRYLGYFDIFALSSDSEQFPISLIEAMAAGLPIVSTDVGDVMAMVPTDQQSCVIEPRDKTQFASALKELVMSPEKRQKLGRSNQAWASARYDETAMIARYAALYGLA